jgi:hypothetical protein
MKRTLKKLLGLAMVGVFAAISSFAVVTPANAVVTRTKHTVTNAKGTWDCWERTNGTYPDTGHYFYCGDPALPVNQTSHENAYSTTIQGLPAFTQTQMINQNVDVYVFCTAKEYEIYFNGLIQVPAGATYRTVASFFYPPNKRVAIFQYQIDATQSCSTATNTGPIDNDPTKKWPIYSSGLGNTRHEVGHFIDQFVNVPASQYKHSLNKVTGTIPLYRQYLQKDIDWINDPSHVACTNWFQAASDTFKNAAGNVVPICNPTRNTELAGISNFQIMQRITNLQYFVKRYTETTGLPTTETWRELFPEEFPWSINQGGSSGVQVNQYIGGNSSYFLCSKRYVEIVSKTGNPPQPSDLVSPYNRCVLP